MNMNIGSIDSHWWELELESKPDFNLSMKRIYAWFEGEIIYSGQILGPTFLLLFMNASLNMPIKDGLFYEWMFRNTNYMMFPDWYGKDSADRVRNWDKTAKYSKVYSFAFDESGVSSEVAQV